MVQVNQLSKATMKDKGLKINVIVNHLRDKIKADNKKLCKQNLHSEQKAFDAGEAALVLMFRTDKEINKAYNMVVGS